MRPFVDAAEAEAEAAAHLEAENNFAAALAVAMTVTVTEHLEALPGGGEAHAFDYRFGIMKAHLAGVAASICACSDTEDRAQMLQYFETEGQRIVLGAIDLVDQLMAFAEGDLH